MNKSGRNKLVDQWMQHQLDVEPQERIFVNRSLRLDSISAVGFDMDHTLAIYKSVPFEELAFSKAQHKLVRKWKYPQAVRRLRYDPQFVIRGLVVDKRSGNILKMDRHRYVTIAYHGTRPLSDEVRKRVYANRRIRLSSNNYAIIDTLFSLPEINLYAQMVDLLDRAGNGRHDYRKLYEHVRDCVDEAHADGSIKRLILQNPERFLQIDPELPQTLHQLRIHGKRLFLLTNSEPRYTDIMMSKLLSGRLKDLPHWSDYFDAVVTKAFKPAFFARRAGFQRAGRNGRRVPKRNRSKLVMGGSVHELERLLKVNGDRVLYFGDHTYGDILRSKHASGWRTAMVLQDLEGSLSSAEKTADKRRRLHLMERQRDRLEGWRDFLERSLEGRLSRKLAQTIMTRLNLSGEARRATLEEHVKVLETALRSLDVKLEQLENEVHQAFNAHWGPMFRAGRESSHFGAQVRSFACIYTSRVSNFLNYPLDKFFQPPYEYLPHEQ
ncbi:MAG: HAD-IG family 5'-nucleotidase [Candidatus Eisenbacteria bacterium]|nr:HAD-IG family 5'-nucleotidase [Candidatus Eisenbacteria bacterium]